MSDTRDRMQSELADLMTAAAKRGRSLAPREPAAPTVSGHCNIIGDGNHITINLSIDGSALAALLGFLAGNGARVS